MSSVLYRLSFLNLHQFFFIHFSYKLVSNYTMQCGENQHLRVDKFISYDKRLVAT